MPIVYPASLDSFANPTASDDLDTPAVLHTTQHANLNDAVEALEAKVGIDGSAVTTSHDYKLSTVTGTNKAETQGNKNQANGYAGLDGSSKLTAGQIPNTAVAPGSYTNTSLTVGADGRLTAASNGASSSPPFTDTTSIVQGSGDATKLLRFEVDGFTTGTTRVVTPPNADITIAGTNFANTFTENQTITQPAASSGTPTAFTVTAGAHTTLTASTEDIGVKLNMSATKQWATGNITTQREVLVQAPTYAFVGASTITEANTLEVDGPPVAGTNATITRRNAAVFVGTTVIRQPGGTAGTDEVQIEHDGTTCDLQVPNGAGTIRILAEGITLVVGDSGHVSSNGKISTGSGFDFVCSGLTDGISFAGDTRIVRSGTNTIRVANGASGNGFLQNSAGEAALESAYTDSDATLGNTALSFTVIAGRSYRIEGFLIVSNSVAGEGFKCDFDGGTATATTFAVALSAVGTNTPGTVVSTTLAGDMNYTSVTGTNYIFVRGYLECNAAGTFIFRASEDTTATGTMTLAAGSWLALYDTVDL